MTWSITSPVTGSAQTGLTSPTYTLVADTFPSPNGKQHAVSALGGTQTGVTTSAVSTPFTVAFVKPAVLRMRTFNVDGKLVSVPMNVYKVIVRKGVIVDSVSGAIKPMLITTTYEVPAGAELVDPANVRAAMSLHGGALAQQSAGVGDTAISGIF